MVWNRRRGLDCVWDIPCSLRNDQDHLLFSIKQSVICLLPGLYLILYMKVNKGLFGTQSYLPSIWVLYTQRPFCGWVAYLFVVYIERNIKAHEEVTGHIYLIKTRNVWKINRYILCWWKNLMRRMFRIQEPLLTVYRSTIILDKFWYIREYKEPEGIPGSLKTSILIASTG